MTVFAALIGWVAKRFSRSGARLYRGLLFTFGVAAIVVGPLLARGLTGVTSPEISE